MLPNKVKDEKELESEGLFYCKEPEDSNSHGVMLRDTAAAASSSGDHGKNGEGGEAGISSDSDDA